MPLKDLFSKPQAPRSVAGEKDDDESSSGDEFEGASSSRGAVSRPTQSSRAGDDDEDEDGGAAGGARGGRARGSNVAKLPIQIRTMDGKTYKIEAKTDWDVQRLKQEFEKWHGGNAAMCSLYYKAKKLQDNNSLQSYNIQAGM